MGDTMEVIDRLYEAINARDPDAIAATCAAEVEWTDMAELPGGGVHRGPAGVHRRFADLAESFDDLRFSREEVVGIGNRVMVRTRVSGVGRESGIPVDTEFFAVFEIGDDRVAAQTAYFDRDGAERALRDA